MMKTKKQWGLWLLLACLTLDVGAGVGQAQPWQMHFQAPATPVMHQIQEFHDLLLWIISGIGVSVLSLIAFVVWKFRASKRPTPATFTHNTKLEIVWTAIPVILLVIIGYPSFRLLYFMEVVPKADMTVKAIAHQWYWSYEYPDHGNLNFDSYLVPDKDLKPGQPRLLTVDNPLYVPVGKNVRVIMTSTDVLHSWAVPSFGVKRDCVPGRLNEAWFRADEPGVYYGQCSELCGPQHGYMPIEVHAVPEEEFKAWLASKKTAPTAAPSGSSPVATAHPAVPAPAPTNPKKE